MVGVSAAEGDSRGGTAHEDCEPGARWMASLDSPCEPGIFSRRNPPSGKQKGRCRREALGKTRQSAERLFMTRIACPSYGTALEILQVL